MVWAILAFLGVPLWLCAAGILVLVLRTRSLIKRAGNIPARVLRPGKSRWTRGHAVWVSDVFAFRGSPAAWREDLAQVDAVAVHDLDEAQHKKLRRLGPGVAVATLSLAGGGSLEVATDGAAREGAGRALRRRRAKRPRRMSRPIRCRHTTDCLPEHDR